MPEHKPFYLKHVGFTGRFKSGAKPLKDLVYLADGAPVDNIAVFTDYIVVGEGGEKTKAYKKVEYGIERGRIITLTPDQLVDIAQGRLALPQPKPVESSNRIVSESPEAAESHRQSELFLWQAKCDVYVERYGIPVADNVRVKMNVRAAKVMQKVFEADIVSMRDNPEYLDRAVEYLSSKWDIPRAVYQNCAANSVTTESPLPRWYLLVNSVGIIIGCYGLITNDFISRQDLWPWLCALYVDEAWRGNGHGARMLEHGRREAKRLGFSKLYLCTNHVGYYEKHGWKYLGDGYAASGEPNRIYEICTE